MATRIDRLISDWDLEGLDVDRQLWAALRARGGPNAEQYARLLGLILQGRSPGADTALLMQREAMARDRLEDAAAITVATVLPVDPWGYYSNALTLGLEAYTDVYSEAADPEFAAFIDHIEARWEARPDGATNPTNPTMAEIASIARLGIRPERFRERYRELFLPLEPGDWRDTRFVDDLHDLSLTVRAHLQDWLQHQLGPGMGGVSPNPANVRRLQLLPPTEPGYASRYEQLCAAFDGIEAVARPMRLAWMQAIGSQEQEAEEQLRPIVAEQVMLLNAALPFGLVYQVDYTDRMPANEHDFGSRGRAQLHFASALQ